MLYSKKTVQTLVITALFAVAMAYLEATIVVYLRKIYYPAGFHFPLVNIPRSVLLIEAGREAATIIMLYALAKLIAGRRQTVLAYFCYSFGIWDIWYYVWLKILLNWPASFLDWDVLFLIPLPWLGPVLAPLLVSIALITAALVMLFFESRELPLHFSRLESALEILAGLLILLSFFTEVQTIPLQQIPQNYHWWLFATGIVLGSAVFIRRVYLRT